MVNDVCYSIPHLEKKQDTTRKAKMKENCFFLNFVVLYFFVFFFVVCLVGVKSEIPSILEDVKGQIRE